VKKRLPLILILIGILLLILPWAPLIKDEVWYALKGREEEPKKFSAFAKSAFAQYLFDKPTAYNPVNKDFALVIEKIGVNVPVIKDVYVSDESAYKESLEHGVAHAASSGYPSRDPGNVYIFAHASLNFWQLGKYSTVFNLLRKLDTGDIIHVFYQGQDYVYVVMNKDSVKGWDTFPLERTVIEPVLTLQTCDPPGTTLNRLIITAKLLDVL